MDKEIIMNESLDFLKSFKQEIETKPECDLKQRLLNSINFKIKKLENNESVKK